MGMLRIPLQIRGTKIYFKSRSPTRQELEDCVHINMTSLVPWEPSQVKLGALSSEALTPEEDLDIHGKQYIYKDANNAMLHSISPALVNLKQLIINNIRVPTSQCIKIQGTTMEDVPAC